eukprot:tig00000017_g5.t1
MADNSEFAHDRNAGPTAAAAEPLDELEELPDGITVITVTRGRPETLLRRAVASVAAQRAATRVPIEHLVLGDGCPATTALPELRAVPSLTFIDVEREERTGPADLAIELGGAELEPSRSVSARLARLRNAGVRAARTRFVAFLDDDNVLLEGHLQSLHDALSAPGAPPLAHSWRRLLDAAGQPLPDRFPWASDADQEALALEAMRRRGVLQAGSDVMRDTTRAEPFPYGAATVDTSEWMARTRFVRDVCPWPEAPPPPGVTEDGSWLLAIAASGAPVACTRRATLLYFAGGRSCPLPELAPAPFPQAPSRSAELDRWAGRLRAAAAGEGAVGLVALGSYARGDAGPTADLDAAFLLPPGDPAARGRVQAAVLQLASGSGPGGGPRPFLVPSEGKFVVYAPEGGPGPGASYRLRKLDCGVAEYKEGAALAPLARYLVGSELAPAHAEGALLWDASPRRATDAARPAASELELELRRVLGPERGRHRGPEYRPEEQAAFFAEVFELLARGAGADAYRAEFHALCLRAALLRLDLAANCGVREHLYLPRCALELHPHSRAAAALAALPLPLPLGPAALRSALAGYAAAFNDVAAAALAAGRIDPAAVAPPAFFEAVLAPLPSDVDVLKN